MKLIRTILFLIISLASTLADIKSDLDCMECHQSGQWLPLSAQPLFDHDMDSDFALLGMHRNLTCRACHLGRSVEIFHSFGVMGISCSQCHQDIHQNYWGASCEDCHSANNWSPAQAFQRHDQTLFPLAAAHHIQECYLCHISPISTPPLDCQECHQSEFYPDVLSHNGVNENSDCSTCHAPTRWNQILAINHDVFFPIRSGEHRGHWDSCNDCHPDANTFQTFTCTSSGCHSLSEMNSEHCEDGSCERCDGLTYLKNVVGSEDCLFCHPRGNEQKCGD